MAVIKAVKGGRSLKRAIDYVGKKAELTNGIDCSDDRQKALQQMKFTKEFYDKTNGRQYKHYIQSFAPGEVSVEKANQLGLEWAEKNFAGFEVYLGTHTDKDHIHNHFIVNSVCFETGKKLHLDKNALEEFKNVNDQICQREGLSIPERGKQSQGQVRAYSMGKYQLLLRVNNGEQVKSHILDTALAADQAINQSSSKKDFIKNMQSQGYKVDWQDHRKHITMTNSDGHKVRMSNLEKTFSEPRFSKEGMQIEFERSEKQSIRRKEQISGRVSSERKRSNEEKCRNIGIGQLCARAIETSGNYLTEQGLSNIQRELCELEKRAGKSIESDIPDNSRTRSENKILKKCERGFSR